MIFPCDSIKIFFSFNCHPGAGREPLAFQVIGVRCRSSQFWPQGCRRLKMDPGLRRDDGEVDGKLFCFMLLLRHSSKNNFKPSANLLA